MAVSIVEGMGEKYRFEIRKGYPVLINEKKLIKKMRHHAEYFHGKDNIVDIEVWMAAKDIAFYSQHILPLCFY